MENFKTMTKVQTINLQGKEYATVPARIKEFREANPNGDIKTKPEIQADGQVIFTAYILKDKENPNSASATGHSIGKTSGSKNFEKLETIAIGRALAILGYMASGDVASSEEMEEFLSYQAEKKENAIQSLKDCKTLNDLKSTFLSLGNLGADKEVFKLKEELKLKLK